jgi:hypothetical protein
MIFKPGKDVLALEFGVVNAIGVRRIAIFMSLVHP